MGQSLLGKLNRDWAIAAGLFGLALGLRLAIVLPARFDGLYGQDPFAYLEYTVQILAGDLAGPYYWPLGYPAVAALFAAVLGDPRAGAQWASMILGSAIAPLGYWIARELTEVETKPSAGRSAEGSTLPPLRVGEGSRWVPFAAGALLAVSGQLLQSSLVVMSDAAGLFWASLSCLALLRYGSMLRANGHPLWLVLAALALSLAAVTRWLFAFLALPWMAYWWWVTPASRRFGLRLAYPAMAALAVLGPQLAISSKFPEPLVQHNWLLGWSLPNAIRTSFENIDGRLSYHFPPLLYNLGPLAHPVYLLPLLTPFVALGAWRLRRAPELILLAGWIGAVYAFLIGIPYENFRFGLAYFTPIPILAAIGLSAWRTLRWPILLVGVIGMAFFGVSNAAGFLDLKRSELDAAEYLERRLPDGAMVYTFGLTRTLDHYTNFQVVELFNESPATLAEGACRGNVYLYVDEGNLASQWQGHPPHQSMLWLQTHAGLKAIGGQGHYTLFEVGGKCLSSIAYRLSPIAAQAT